MLTPRVKFFLSLFYYNSIGTELTFENIFGKNVAPAVI